MKTRNLIFAILWAVLALLMLVCAVMQFHAGEIWAVTIAAMAFGCDSYTAWNQLGIWLESRKAMKRTKKEVFTEYDKTMAEWEQGFPET